MRTVRARARALAVVVVCAAALAASATACGGSDDGAEPENGAEPSKNDGVFVPDELDFATQTVDGADFEGASLAGQDAVLWFWAPWCTICAGEAPAIRDAAETHGADVAFLGVAGLGETSEMRTFVADHQLDGFEHAVDADGSLWARFGVTSQPAAAFIDDDGSVDVVPGTMSAADLNDRIQQLLDS
jgi:peroxiredoxin